MILGMPHFVKPHFDGKKRHRAGWSNSQELQGKWPEASEFLNELQEKTMETDVASWSCLVGIGLFSPTLW